MSILSPRNFLKIISTGIDGLRKNGINSPNNNNYAEFLTTFEPYLKTFETDYKKHKESKALRKNINSKNE